MRARRPRTLVFAFTAAIMLAVAALLLADLWWQRDRELRMAETRATNLTTALGEYVREKFRTADAALRQLDVHARRVGGSAAAAPEWVPILEAAHAALRDSGSISIVDPQGIIRHSTLPAIVGQSRASSGMYRQLRDAPSEVLSVDLPFPTPLRAGRSVLPVGRRLESAAGEFDGLAVAVVLPETFREFFRTVRIGSEGAIWVFHQGGAVLFREPTTTDPLGEQAMGNPILQAALAHGRGVLRAPLEADGPRLVSAYRKVEGLPLVWRCHSASARRLRGGGNSGGSRRSSSPGSPSRWPRSACCWYDR